MALPNTTQYTAPPTPEQTAAGIKDALTDRSQHIRTMAKDLAALATSKNRGWEQEEAVVTEESVPEKPHHETISGVTTDVAEQPFFERQLPRREREPQEIVELPTVEEASAIVEPTPIVAPIQNETQRFEILERLRNRVGETAHMAISETPNTETPIETAEPAWPDIPTPPAQFPEQTPVNVIAPARPSITKRDPAPVPFLPISRATPQESTQPSISNPYFATAQLPQAEEVITPRGTDQYREPLEDTPAPKPTAKQPTPQPSMQSDLQTYSGDFADHISSSEASAFSVLAAEQDAQLGTAPREERSAGTPRTLITIATGVVLLGLAGGGMYAAYQMVMTMRATPIARITVPTVIFTDGYRELSGTGAALVESLASSINEPLLAGKVIVTYILSSETDENNTLISRPVGGGRLFLTMQLPAPDILLRNIREEGSAGILNSNNGSSPFFVLRVDSYERTFAGMLTWEPLMFQDLSRLFPLHSPRNPSSVDLNIQTDTSIPAYAREVATNTSTPSQPATQGRPRTRFEDAIVQNRDVRILRDTNGEALLLYGYADKQTLIIARDELAFEALLSRLTKE